MGGVAPPPTRSPPRADMGGGLPRPLRSRYVSSRGGSRGSSRAASPTPTRSYSPSVPVPVAPHLRIEPRRDSRTRSKTDQVFDNIMTRSTTDQVYDNIMRSNSPAAMAM